MGLVLLLSCEGRVGAAHALCLCCGGCGGARAPPFLCVWVARPVFSLFLTAVRIVWRVPSERTRRVIHPFFRTSFSSRVFFCKMFKSVYVAGKNGSAEEKEYIRSAQAQIRKTGLVISHDWTAETVGETESYYEYLARCAKLDMDGVRAADVVVALMMDPKYAYRGTFTEIGGALALGRVVVIVSPHDYASLSAAENCFFHHPSVIHVRTIDEAMPFITGRPQ
jgi:hypothetical protein